jgi:hypothetical protein
MSSIMELLRGPALGVVALIILLAGGILIAAFAALIAQFGLLIRLKPWNYTGRNSADQRPEVSKTEPANPVEPPFSPQGKPTYQNADEVVDAIWWEEER